MEPREVTAPGGTKRWIAADGKSYDSLDKARAASQGVTPVWEGRSETSSLKLFHLTSPAGFLRLQKSAWIVARDAERALTIWLSSFDPRVDHKGVAGEVQIYEYVPRQEGPVDLEHSKHLVAIFSEEDQSKLLTEIISGNRRGFYGASEL